MKIFLSWSGARSRAVAEALNDWLRRVIQAVKPFYSPEMEKGAKWSNEIDDALAGTHFGIVCLTPENLKSTWIHFETGALSKTKDAIIWTFLHGLLPADVPPPLGKFQHTIAKKEDTLLLLKTINRRLGEIGGEPLTERLLEENFETFWPQLEAKLASAEKLGSVESRVDASVAKASPREERAILDEILELVRNQERRLGDFEDRLPAKRQKPRRDSKPESILLLEIPISSKETKEAESVATEVARFFEVMFPSSDIVKMKTREGPLVSVTFDPPISANRIHQILTQARVATAYDIPEWEVSVV